MLLYSDVATHEIILELWGSSTKHPDEVCRLYEDAECGRYQHNYLCGGHSFVNIGQWLLAVAARQLWWTTSQEIAELALEFLKNA